MEFFAYLQEAVTAANLTVTVIGIVVGIAFGAMPGLSSTFACAVLLPVTFTMAPTTALLFLGAVYMGSTYGGAFAAILVNTPGTPQSITTTFDGFPMARRGDGDLALTIACLASVFGGLVGIFAFIAFAPPLAQVALKFGPAETFWLALFGLTIIASLSEGNVLKGLVSGSIGLALSMIGIAVVSGDARFTYESTTLIAGIDIIPATIGLLCLPVLFDLIATPDHHLETPKGVARPRLGEAWRAMTGRKLTAVRASVVGTVIGILPGAGGAIASLVAYSDAKRSAPDGEGYGTGNPGGIVASESANNATVGSGLVPTFVLGIPGTPPDAVILGAMLVHGVQIGPKLFSEHGDVVYTFTAGLLIATLLMLPIGILAGRFIYRLVLATPKRVLLPLIVMLTVVGAFAIRNSMGDVAIMFALGAFAWTIGRFGYPAAPIVLGILLGPIAEQGFSQAYLVGNAKGDLGSQFFGGLISPILVTLIALAVTGPPIAKLMRRRRSARPVRAS